MIRVKICKWCGEEFSTLKNYEYCSGSCAESMKSYQSMLRDQERKKKPVPKYGQQMQRGDKK